MDDKPITLAQVRFHVAMYLIDRWGGFMPDWDIEERGSIFVFTSGKYSFGIDPKFLSSAYLWRPVLDRVCGRLILDWQMRAIGDGKQCSIEKLSGYIKDLPIGSVGLENDENKR